MNDPLEIAQIDPHGKFTSILKKNQKVLLKTKNFPQSRSRKNPMVKFPSRVLAKAVVIFRSVIALSSHLDNFLAEEGACADSGENH